MAVTKFAHLDEIGVQTLATYLLRSTNSRIKERIATSIAAGSYSDAEHVLSSAAILGLLGNIGNYDSMTGQESTVLGKVKALDVAIGSSSDASSENTVYGAIQGVRESISALTHLTYQVVTGDIEVEVPMAQAREDVIYLQHDEASYSVGNDGYLLTSAGAHATANDGTNDYEAWVDPADGKIYKMVSGVKGAELASNDAIFANVALVEDTTYTLYICQLTKTGDVVTGIKWLAVGDTTLTLSNYWSKSDADVNALKNQILESISDATIITKVAAAYAATDPYTGGTNAFAPAEWDA